MLPPEPGHDAPLSDRLAWWEQRRELSRGTRDWPHANFKVDIYRRLVPAETSATAPPVTTTQPGRSAEEPGTSSEVGRKGVPCTSRRAEASAEPGTFKDSDPSARARDQLARFPASQDDRPSQSASERGTSKREPIEAPTGLEPKQGTENAGRPTSRTGVTAGRDPHSSRVSAELRVFAAKQAARVSGVR